MNHCAARITGASGKAIPKSMTVEHLLADRPSVGRMGSPP
jgi:hypothetical protein